MFGGLLNEIPMRRAVRRRAVVNAAAAARALLAPKPTCSSPHRLSPLKAGPAPPRAHSVMSLPPHHPPRDSTGFRGGGNANSSPQFRPYPHHARRATQETAARGPTREAWDYNKDVDPATGESLPQVHFNQLAFRALLRHGPALPVEAFGDAFLGGEEAYDISEDIGEYTRRRRERAARAGDTPPTVCLACDYPDDWLREVLSPTAPIQRHQHHRYSPGDHENYGMMMHDEERGGEAEGYDDVPSSSSSPPSLLNRKRCVLVFSDDVRLRPPDLLALLRREEPSYSIKRDGGGVPFSLLIRNCSYFRAHAGFIEYQRVLWQLARRRAPSRRGPAEAEEAGGQPHRDSFLCDDTDSFFVFTIGTYRLREVPSQDGIRCGPQPWLYSAALR